MGPYNLQRTKNERDKSSAYIIQKEDTFQIKKIPKKKWSTTNNIKQISDCVTSHRVTESQREQEISNKKPPIIMGGRVIE